MAVDFLINSRLEAGNTVLIAANRNVATRAAARTDRRGVLEIPDPHFKAKIAVRERPDRADVVHICRERVVEDLIWKQGDRGTVTAIDHGQLFSAGYLLEKANTAGAVDTALGIKDHMRTKDLPLAIMLLSLYKSALFEIVLHVIILEQAFPRLVADRAVQRMVDEEKLHNGPSCLQDLGALRFDRHPLVHLCVTGDLEFGHLLYLHQTHAAVACNREFGVITVMGDGDPQIRGRLDHGLPLGRCDFLSVDDKFNRVHVIH